MINAIAMLGHEAHVTPWTDTAAYLNDRLARNLRTLLRLTDNLLERIKNR
jgi:hypothetical protein